jgi:hypothetical protein
MNYHLKNRKKMSKTTGMIMPAEHKTSLKMENRAKSEKPLTIIANLL